MDLIEDDLKTGVQVTWPRKPSTKSLYLSRLQNFANITFLTLFHYSLYKQLFILKYNKASSKLRHSILSLYLHCNLTAHYAHVRNGRHGRTFHAWLYYVICLLNCLADHRIFVPKGVVHGAAWRLSEVVKATEKERWVTNYHNHRQTN